MIDIEIWVRVMAYIAEEKYYGRIKDEDVTKEYILEVKKRLTKKQSLWKRLFNRSSKK